ncbi:MAG: DsbA family protein [Dermatophilaceae bacterium]
MATSRRTDRSEGPTDPPPTDSSVAELSSAQRPPAELDTITIWGDFTCPWSYLAWARSELLVADGATVDWRTVEHDPWHYLSPVALSDRYQGLHAEMPQVLAHLLPDEDLPYTLAGFVPFTAAATSAYAEAYVSGVGQVVRDRLFTAFWRHGVDLNNAKILQTMLADDVRQGTSSSELVQYWGYALDVTGGPITSEGWQVIRDWRAQWQKASGVTPTLVVGSGEPIIGVAAVDWLGERVRERDLLRDDRNREHPAA